jgi:hypothetical protein
MAIQQQHSQHGHYGQATHERWELDHTHVRGTGTLALLEREQKLRLV